MFARSTSSTRRTRTPLRLSVISLSLAMAATFGPPAATMGDPGHSGDAPYRGRVISLMRHMTLQQKVGQLFVIEVAGRDATVVSDAAKAVNQRLYGVDTPAQAIAKYQPGGVIYYSTRVPCTGCGSDDNIGDPAQVATLSNGLQAAALAQPAHIPLQISVDQEGGALVARFLAPATQMPGNMALGAGRSTKDAYDSAKVIGEELESVGVTQDYAPVSDVNINPNNPVIGIRSIGGDPDLVSDLASSQVKGYHAGGVSAVAKHFPGHGDTGVDSHFGLPQVTHTLEQFHAIDLPPFKADIAAGVDTIMTAHVVFPAVDPSEAPATMSHEILTGVLRDELGFKGLIVTDALDMGGATSTYPPNVAPVQAILAGADQLLIPPQMDTAYGAVLDAVRNGTISKKRLDDSVYRVLLHKFRHGIFPDPLVDPAAATTIMGAPEHLAEAQAITDRTTTLVKNDAGLLPLTAGPRNVLVAGLGCRHDPVDRDRAGRAGRDDPGPGVRHHAVGRRDRRSRRRGADQRPRPGVDQQRLRDQCHHRATDGGRRGADPAGEGSPRDREAGRGRRDAQPLRRRLVPRGAHRARHLRLHRGPGRVAGAGDLRRGEPDRPAAGLHPPRRRHRRAVPVRPRPGLLTVAAQARRSYRFPRPNMRPNRSVSDLPGLMSITVDPSGSGRLAACSAESVVRT